MNLSLSLSLPHTHTHTHTHISQVNSFQCVLITDGNSTYVLFLYHCDLLQSGGGGIGYIASSGGNFYQNHRWSLQSSSSSYIGCDNRPLSNWNTVLYPIHYNGMYIKISP